MGRERTAFKREKKGDIIINIAEIFRNPEMQEQAIDGCKKLKRTTKTSVMEKEDILKKALLEAAEWESQATYKECSSISVAEAKQRVLNRIYKKYKNKILPLSK